MAPWPGQLIIGRGVQGVAAAISVPAALRLLTAVTFSAGQRNRALGAWSATGAVAGASGYLLGGVLTDVAGWRSLFWVNLPAALLLGIAVRSQLPELERDAKRSLDITGAVFLTATVMCLVLGLSSLQPPVHLGLGLGFLVACLLAALALVWEQRRSPDPLLAGAALTHGLLRSGARAAFANTATTSSAIALSTLELQRVYHVSAADAGLRLIPFSLGAILGSRLASLTLKRRTRPTTIAIGLTIIAIGNVLLATTDGPGVTLSMAVAAAGLGIGLSSVAATALAIDVPDALKATAAGLINTTAQLGTAIGVATVLLITSSGQPKAGWSLAAAISILTAAVTVVRAPQTK